MTGKMFRVVKALLNVAGLNTLMGAVICQENIPSMPSLPAFPAETVFVTSLKIDAIALRIAGDLLLRSKTILKER